MVTKEYFKVNKELKTKAGGVLIADVQKWDSEPAFFKVYINRFSQFQNLPDSTKIVLGNIVTKMDYNDNSIALVSGTKKKISNETGLQYSTIEKAIYELGKKTILIRPDKNTRGNYIVNPLMFGRGGYKRLKRIVMCIEFDEKGEKFKVDFEQLEKNLTP